MDRQGFRAIIQGKFLELKDNLSLYTERTKNPEGLFQDPNKTIQLKKRKKVLKGFSQRNQIIHKGQRCHEISPRQHMRPGNMGQHCQETQRKKLRTKDFITNQVSLEYQSYRKITFNIQ